MMYCRLKALFPDIDLEIKENKISSKLFCKRDSFSSEIVRMSSDSNISSKIFYSSMGSEKFFHLARNTSNRLTFIMLVN